MDAVVRQEQLQSGLLQLVRDYFHFLGTGSRRLGEEDGHLGAAIGHQLSTCSQL